MTEEDFKKELGVRLMSVSNLLMEYYNPCGFTEGRSGCRVGDPVPCCQAPFFDSSKPCKFLKDGQCALRNIDCSLWFCRTALEHMDETCKRSFYALESIAIDHNIVHRPFLGKPYKHHDLY